MESESLARIYAADFLKRDDVEWVACQMYDIMEMSIRNDNLVEQEVTKDFLTRIVEIMNQHDKKYTEEITRAYLDLTLELLTEGIK